MIGASGLRPQLGRHVRQIDVIIEPTQTCDFGAAYRHAHTAQATQGTELDTTDTARAKSCISSQVTAVSASTAR